MIGADYGRPSSTRPPISWRSPGVVPSYGYIIDWLVRRIRAFSTIPNAMNCIPPGG